MGGSGPKQHNNIKKLDPHLECVVYILSVLLHLSQLVATQVELLQSSPSTDGFPQVQSSDAVLTEHQLSDVTGLPELRARQVSNVVGPHVHGS